MCHVCVQSGIALTSEKTMIAEVNQEICEAAWEYLAKQAFDKLVVLVDRPEWAVGTGTTKEQIANSMIASRNPVQIKEIRDLVEEYWHARQGVMIVQAYK